MKPTKLTKSMRVVLRDHAVNLRLAGPQKDVLKVAYKKLYARVSKLMDAAYPPDEMALLEKYGCTSKIRRVTLRLDVGGEKSFHTKVGDEFTIPSTGNHHWRVHLFDKPGCSDLFDAWQDAHYAYVDAKKALIKAYSDLIFATNTYEELVAVWPEAEAVRSRIVVNSKPKQQVMLLPAEAVAAVQRDVAERAAA